MKLSETFFDSMLTYIIEKVRFVFLFFLISFLSVFVRFFHTAKKCISCLFHVQQILFFPAFEPLAKVLTDPDSALNLNTWGPMTRSNSTPTTQYGTGYSGTFAYIYIRIYLLYLLTYSKNQSFMDEYCRPLDLMGV